MSVGQIFITVYFALAYWLPAVGNFLFSENIVSIYRIYPGSLYAFGMLFGVYFLYIKLAKTELFKLPQINQLYTFMGFFSSLYQKLRLVIALIAFITAIFNCYFDLGLNFYRYGTLNILERNSVFLVFSIFIKTMISVDMFYFMFIQFYEDIKFKIKVYLENILLSVALLLMADGTINAFFAFLAIFYSLSPHGFRSLIFNKSDATIFNKIIKFVLSILIIFTIFLAAWLYGEAIKKTANSTNKTQLLTKEILDPKKTNLLDNLKALTEKANEHFNKKFFYYLIERPSIYYYSYMMTLNIDATKKIVVGNNSILPLTIPFNTFLFRADYLLGGFLEIKRPEIISISQLNYQILTTQKINNRAGSSPGLLGSFNYLFNFPFNVIFCALYLAILSLIFDVLLDQRKSKILSIQGFILAFFYLEIFFDSPFDLLMIIDDSLIYVGLLLGLVLWKQRVKNKNWTN